MKKIANQPASRLGRREGGCFPPWGKKEGGKPLAKKMKGKIQKKM